MLTGLYGIIAHQNLVRQLVGLNILQVSVFVLYISLAYVQGGTVPIIAPDSPEYVSPLPHVLILTAIVVGIATTAVGLALAVKIHGAYGSLDESELKKAQEHKDSTLGPRQTRMVEAHLPAMCVVLPLLAAPLCLLLRRPAVCWGLAMLAAMAMLACAWLMAGGGSATVIEYSFGNWEAPYGIEYRIDALSMPFLLLIGVMAVAALLHARNSVSSDRKHLLYLSILLHLSGLAGVISTADIFNMFVFIEITSLSAYTLLAMGKQRDALLAAFRYLIQGSIGATFILIGTGYLYAMTGTLNMPDMAVRLAQLEASNTVTMAYIFLSLGFAIKFALFPLHGWLVGAYRHAPAAVAALFAATGTKIYLAAWLRVSFTLFDQGQDSYLLGLAPVLATAAGLAIIAGTVGALRHQRLRGILANSTIAHVGYMMLGIATGSQAGIAAALVIMYAHGLMKGAMFLAAGRLELAAGSDSLRALRGVGRGMPWTMVAVIVAGLGLMGAPLTFGFIGKMAAWQRLCCQRGLAGLAAAAGRLSWRRRICVSHSERAAGKTG